MSLNPVTAQATAADLGAFDAIIDARSPAEFAEDHLPGAVNWPVLDDEQRRVVGTLYKQVSALEARKVGAAMVARNIAAHVEREAPGLAREWKPLVYCWRGGQRSGAVHRTLLVGSGEDDQRLLQGSAHKGLGGSDGNGKEALHIGAAKPVEPMVTFSQLQRVRLP
jgi:tRNA 2-selenouridine synthase SelU